MATRTKKGEKSETKAKAKAPKKTRSKKTAAKKASPEKKPAAKKTGAKKTTGAKKAKRTFTKVVKNQAKNPRTWEITYRLIDGPDIKK